MSHAAVRRRVAACLAGGRGFDAACSDVFACGAKPPSRSWLAAQRTAIARESLALVARGDPAFPCVLTSIPDPPFALFVNGELDALVQKSVAIVGSRRCAPGSERFAHALARAVASAGIAVVSGLAIGIDGAAHRGALDAAGVTVAVLGSGHAQLYPRRHRRLAAAIVERGATVSELPPMTPPWPANFPERNRLISGLAHTVVVVEAGEKSGSLTTARMALEQGRDVMAVPGSPLNGRSRGCHRLIQAGAGLVDEPGDVLANLGVQVPAPTAPRELDAWTARVLGAVPADDVRSLDEVIERVELPIERLLETLGRLEVDGFVDRIDGGYIRRPR